MSVVPRDGRIDLHRHAEIFEIAEPGQGRVECARDVAKLVVRGRVHAVETDGHALHAAVDNLARDFLGNQCSIRG